LNAGLTSGGGLFLGSAEAGQVDLSREAIELRLAAEPQGGRYRVVLSAHDVGSGKPLGMIDRYDIAADRLVGTLALVANFPPAGARTPPAAGAPRAKGNAGGAGSSPNSGSFWFADWRVEGTKVEAHDDRAFGPILFSQYTLSRGVLKLTAQMPPMGPGDSRTVRLQTRKDGEWRTLAEEPIHPEARTATFRVEGWDDGRDTPYRLAYTLKSLEGGPKEHHWSGTVRRDPADAPVLTVADVSCNMHSAFPNADYVAHMAGLDPDLLAFTGDQFYEPSGGYGVQRAPLEAAILDLLRKWYLHGWTWRELMRDRPSVSIPDDHDVSRATSGARAAGPRGRPRRPAATGCPPPGSTSSIAPRPRTTPTPSTRRRAAGASASTTAP
jgi:hypothetical protein